LNFGALSADFKISRRNFLAVTLLSSSTFAWFLVIFSYWGDIFSLSVKVDLFWINVGSAVFIGVSVLSVLVGSMVAEKVNIKRFLWSWVILGILSTASLAIFHGVIFSLVACILLGISFGLGFPSCLGFLSNYAAPEERGRIAGSIFFEAFVFVIIAFVIAQSSLVISEIAGVIIILICLGLRSLSILPLVLVSFQRKQGRERSWKSILGNRNLVLYLIPWVMFNIAAGLFWFVLNWINEQPNGTSYDWAINMGNGIHFLMPVVFGLISGVVADRFGRRQPVIFGMVLLGISFALLAVLSPLSLISYLAISGVAWGFLMVVFATVPGDLASGGSPEKFYALCSILPLIVNLSIGGIANFSGFGVQAVALSLVLSIIIFASVIPVFRATETLSESIMREKEAREHIKKVEKLVKESRKNNHE
jgi:MFS family permease